MESKDTNTKPTNTGVMHSFKDSKNRYPTSKVVMLLILIVLFGIGSGYSLVRYTGGTTGKNVPLESKDGTKSTGKIFGSDDTTTFKDTAEGELEEGGIEGEGQYHLVRPGGDSQNVYMTSSTVDLSQFVGKKIKVWGQTQTAQTAGWLMDVGRVEVL